ncbi:MAG: hypothetical protein EA379_11330 [Phycisphaerales bacterium]|nr:MAG: hypothetical protein EA379_11330 [Phycisphaerales bacterium]
MNRFRIDLLIVLIALGAPFLQWLIVKLREQAEVAKRKREHERQKAEALRTGRPIPAEPVGAPAAKSSTKADAARSRQERLREIRQRQMEEARKRQRPTASPAPRPTPSVRTGGAPTAQPTATQRPVPIPTRQTQPTPTPRAPATIVGNAPGVSERARQIEEARRQQREKLERARGDAERATRGGASGDKPGESRKYESVFATVRRARAAHLGDEEEMAEELAVAASPLLGRLTRADARRAIVMMELLSPPIAMRSNDPLDRLSR